MHDIPYVKSNHYEPEIIASMTRLCTEIKEILPKTTSCGIQVMILNMITEELVKKLLCLSRF